MSERQAERQAAEHLRARGVRPTAQRIRILAELAREPNDATAQELHERLAPRGRIGLATVYRTLGVLAAEGIVDVLVHDPGVLCYRLCGDSHHHHLVCTSCHAVAELSDCSLDEWLERTSAEHGFTPTGHRLEVTGLCAACRSAG
jgi:Fur family ferric uptake transcriptional regulator